MTLAELGIALGFNIKEQDVDKVNNTISGIKNTATRLLGAIGVGFSLVSINTMVEEFTRVNNQIKSATDGLGEQREIQDDIAAAAEATRTSYSMAANTISLLVKGNRDLFWVTPKFCVKSNECRNGAKFICRRQRHDRLPPMSTT